MTLPAPFYAQWNGEHFVPMRRFMRAIGAAYKAGEIYRLAEENERSRASHNHYFARIAEVWKTLPEDVAELYPSAEHLRKRALVQAGYYDEEVIDCGSQDVAVKVATAIRKRDDFSVIFVRGTVTVSRSAKSQSLKAMGKDEFRKSKDKVLEILADLIKVDADELDKAESA